MEVEVEVEVLFPLPWINLQTELSRVLFKIPMLIGIITLSTPQKAGHPNVKKMSIDWQPIPSKPNKMSIDVD